MSELFYIFPPDRDLKMMPVGQSYIIQNKFVTSLYAVVKHRIIERWKVFY